MVHSLNGSLLLPGTDSAVAVEAVVAAVVFGLALFAVRRDRDVRVLVFGLATVTFVFFAFRALH
jgi:hypothetical protein